MLEAVSGWFMVSSVCPCRSRGPAGADLALLGVKAELHTHSVCAQCPGMDLKGAPAVHFNLPLLTYYLYTTFKTGIAAACEPIPLE